MRNVLNCTKDAAQRASQDHCFYGRFALKSQLMSCERKSDCLEKSTRLFWKRSPTLDIIITSIEPTILEMKGSDDRDTVLEPILMKLNYSKIYTELNLMTQTHMCVLTNSREDMIIAHTTICFTIYKIAVIYFNNRIPKVG